MVESYGFRCNATDLSREEEKAIEIPGKTTKLLNGRYQVGLLYLEDEKVPKNHYSAFNQLCSRNEGCKRTPICDNGLRQQRTWAWGTAIFENLDQRDGRHQT